MLSNTNKHYFYRVYYISWKFSPFCFRTTLFYLVKIKIGKTPIILLLFLIALKNLLNFSLKYLSFSSTDKKIVAHQYFKPFWIELNVVKFFFLINTTSLVLWCEFVYHDEIFYWQEYKRIFAYLNEHVWDKQSNLKSNWVNHEFF